MCVVDFAKSMHLISLFVCVCVCFFFFSLSFLVCLVPQYSLEDLLDVVQGSRAEILHQLTCMHAFELDGQWL